MRNGIATGLTRSLRRGSAAVWLFVISFGSFAQEYRPGVWTGRDLSAFPLPVSGYDVYLMGELHGVKETESVLEQYLSKLYDKAGLRDVALEEKSAYERDAQSYVEGKSNNVPAALCLRAGILDIIRNFNKGRTGSGLIHVHLVDIDLNTQAIRMHLLALKAMVPGAEGVSVPAVDGIKEHGVETVAALQRLTTDEGMLGELRTIGHSIRASQLGLDVGAGEVKGSPYLDDREDAITSNITDVLHQQHGLPVLALYGNDHVSRTLLNNGGPKQNAKFPPLALRLSRAGIKVFSVVTVPLAGRSSWRGADREVMWEAGDARLSNGETLESILAGKPGSTLIYIDRRQEQATMPSYDLTKSGADAFLLFAHGTSMENRCTTP